MSENVTTRIYRLSSIPVDDIVVAEDRMRGLVEGMPELVESIRVHGLIHPIAVAERDDGKYLLLAGFRRLTAMKALGYREVPARVYLKECMNEYVEKSIELEENLRRKDLRWSEVASATAMLHDLYVKIYGKALPGPTGRSAWTEKKTASLINKSRSSVSADLELSRAIEIFPQLKACKTKQEALNMLRKLKHDARVQERLEYAKSKISNTDVAKLKNELADAYKVGDFFIECKSLPPDHFELIEVDPPYGTDLPGVANSADSLVEYREITRKERLDFYRRTIDECKRLLHPAGWLLFWSPWAVPIAQLLEEAGLTTCVCPIIWYKPFHARVQNPRYQLPVVAEYCAYARKGPEASIYTMGSSPLLSIPPTNAARKIHPVDRPVEVLQEILRIFGGPGSTVLVPFAGSGTTLLAASNLHMIPLGFDLSSEYRDRYRIRVLEGEYGRYKSLD